VKNGFIKVPFSFLLCPRIDRTFSSEVTDINLLVLKESVKTQDIID
jgi:hypothetical protein